MKKFSEFRSDDHLVQDLVTFCEKRKDGAEKIAKKAEEKGGLSMLTAYHFFAKLPAYDDAIKHIKLNKIKDFLDKKVNELKSKINPEKMKQKEFQEIAGEMEVYGEIICRMNSKT